VLWDCFTLHHTKDGLKSEQAKKPILAMQRKVYLHGKESSLKTNTESAGHIFTDSMKMEDESSSSQKPTIRL
jgi:hypothetical protein